MIYMKIGFCCIVLVMLTWLCGMSLKALTKSDTKSAAEIYIMGFLSMISLFGVVSIPLKILNVGFHIVIFIYLLVMAVYILMGFILYGKDYCSIMKAVWKHFRQNCSAIFVLLVIFVLIQLVGILLMQVNALDDTSYQGVTWQAVYHNQTIPDVITYTGRNIGINLEPSRFCSTYPLWVAVISKIGRLSPIIVYHMVMTIYIFPLMYISYFLLGKLCFNNSKKLYLFLIVFGLLSFCGFTGDNAVSTYVMLYTWYGKVISAAVILPLVLYYAVKALDARFQNRIYWSYLFLCMVTSLVFSSLGVILSVVVFGGATGYYIVKYKRLKDVVYSLIMCIPAAFSLLIYKVIVYIIK